MNRLIRALSVLIIIVAVYVPQVRCQGLLFHGNETDIANRSGLILPDPDSKVNSADKIRVSFSLKVNNVNSSGFIFGIKDRDSSNMLNLMMWKGREEDMFYISLNREGEREFCSVGFTGTELLSRKIGVEVWIDRSKDGGKAIIDGKEFPLTNLGLDSGDFLPQINFGLTRYIVETASVTVSDLEIEVDGTRTEIPLNESTGTRVHDSRGKVAGRVFNPNWQINRSYYWEKLVEFSSPTPSGCSFDPIARKFYSYNADTLAIYDDIKGETTRIALTGTGLLPVKHGMNFYSGKQKRIYPYEIYYDNYSYEIDPASGRWRELLATVDNKAIHHHAHVWCSNDSAMLFFGGYGDRKYSNQLVKFNLYTHKFDTIPLKGDFIAPRFFASMDASESGDTLYLYGGKGNQEGKQDLGVKYFYDFYRITLSDSTARKLWTHKTPDKERVPARTLLVDGSRGIMYAMTYAEYKPHTTLQLYQISISDGSEIAVGDTIPMISEEIATNVSLYMPEDGEVIYCVLQEFEKEGATNTRIYSIVAPPVSKAELSIYDTNTEAAHWCWLWIGGVLILVAVGVMFVLVRRNRKRIKPIEKEIKNAALTNVNDSVEASSVLKSGVDAEQSVQENMPFTLPSDEPENPARPDLPYDNRISLFGPFIAIDNSGHDVTHLFSPKLRAIFIYILLGTWKKSGVTASELSAVFWADKEPDKIKNLRNVTIAKLRKILSDFSGLEIVYDNGRFMVRSGENCYVDIYRLFALTNDLQKEPSGKEAQAEVETIILQGKFLQGMESEELDRYKAPVEAFMLDVMLKTIEKFSAKRQWKEVIRFSHLTLLTDALNESAMQYGVKAYEATGNKTRARNLYDTFIANYHKVYGETYQVKFSEIEHS